MSDNWYALIGKKFRNNKTGKVVTVIHVEGSMWGKVWLLHKSGKTTCKLRHYFDYDYTEIKEGGE